MAWCCLLRTESWLQEIADSTGGFDPSVENKIVVVDNTIAEGKVMGAPHPDQFAAPELKSRWGGYAKILGDGLATHDHEIQYTPGTISANNSKCFLCSVRPGNSADHVGGPEGCEIKDECEADNPVESYQKAYRKADMDITPSMPLPAGLGSADEAPLPDTWMLWNEVTVYCVPKAGVPADEAAAGGCGNRELLMEVLKGYILFNATTNDYGISVTPVAVHGAAANFTDAAVTDLAAGLAPDWSPDIEPACQQSGVYTKYDVRVTATDPAVEQHLLDVFEELAATPGDLEQSLQTNDAGDDSDAEICAVAVVEKGETRYPSIKKMPAFKPSEKLVFAPNLVVADDTSIVPLSKLAPGETYKIYVQNFPQGSKVNIKLMNGWKLDGPTVATIDSFEDDGTHEVLWTVPEGVKATGACVACVHERGGCWMCAGVGAGGRALPACLLACPCLCLCLSSPACLHACLPACLCCLNLPICLLAW